MITHEEVRRFLSNFDYWLNEETADIIQKYFNSYITEQQAKDKEHEELKRDVKRYFELRDKGGLIFGSDESVEMYRLRNKLSKVGKEE